MTATTFTYEPNPDAPNNITEGTLQTYTVPVTGEYQITVEGAAGGGDNAVGGPKAGGAGAEVAFDVTLTAGTTLDVLVGAEGQTGDGLGFGAGGGGASAVYIPGSTTPIAVAGGGGGVGYEGASGGPGLATPLNNDAGGSAFDNGGAGGGGSFVAAGTSSSEGGVGGGALDGSASGGITFTTNSPFGNGGYGGGGGGGGGEATGGGGGGYGGGAGGSFSNLGGGGGGSFVDTVDYQTTNVVEDSGVNPGNGEVVIELLCFLKGVRISTPSGETPVEDLRPGDFVLTLGGKARPIRWVGVQTIATRFADPMATSPIRIREGALGEGLPKRDLLVSPGHALFIEGLLINAGALVNGVTITRETDLPERFQYFHIELNEHAVLLAEGFPAESFLDAVEPTAFDNHRERAEHVGETAPLQEMPYARVKARRQVPTAILRRLEALACGDRPERDAA